jgi:adenosylcobinamide kinase / adenosylcobinamide-phosphate guanylyltransferase
VLVDETFGTKADHGTGHLDLATLPSLLDALRAHGSIVETTTVAATHLSHHNPPSTQLRGILADLGVRLVDDLDVIDTTRPHAGLPRRTLVLGGARSGKSHLAEQAAAGHERVTYVATGGTRPDDAEWIERVSRHRARRPAAWTTIETADVTSILGDAQAGSLLLVDCLALWLTAMLDDVDAWGRMAAGDRARVEQDAQRRIVALRDALSACPADVILVSNEVGMGVVPETASGRLFRDLLGILNARIAADCDRTTLVVAGIAMDLTPTTPGARHAR